MKLLNCRMGRSVPLRTATDLLITNQLLYQLSHSSKCEIVRTLQGGEKCPLTDNH